MKKIFAIVICIAMMLTMFATVNVNAAIMLDATDAEWQVNFSDLSEYNNADSSPNGHNVVNYTNVDDSYTFIVEIVDSGVYEFRTDVCSPWGIGAFDVYVDGELAAQSEKFVATGEGDNAWNNYAHSEYTYINFEDDGEYEIKYVLTQDGINLKLPVARFYDVVMPGQTLEPTAEPTATPAPTEAPTEVPTEAPTEAPATEAPKATEAPAEEEGGCGSSVAIAQIMLILGVAVVLKKRK